MKYSVETMDVLERAKGYSGIPFHAMLCDPPYHLLSKTRGNNSVGGFMGRTWDGACEISFKPETWSAQKEHLHPGAFIMAFGGSRGFHRLACAIEDAGFIIHPTICWVYGSGFPKATRIKNISEFEGHRYGLQALKPAAEFIVVAQKPYDGKPVDCMAGTGAWALNIDACRLPGEGGVARDGELSQNNRYAKLPGPRGGDPTGRWPSNLILDGSDEVKGLFPDSAGQLAAARNDGVRQNNSVYGALNHVTRSPNPRIETDKSAARFFNQCPLSELDHVDPIFYCSKAAKRERSLGLEEKNTHPCVKPVKLCEHLAKLLSPPIEYAPRRLLVPFSGSGSEMLGAMVSGQWEEVVGIESDESYAEISHKRLTHWCKQSTKTEEFEEEFNG